VSWYSKLFGKMEHAFIYYLKKGQVEFNKSWDSLPESPFEVLKIPVSFNVVVVPDRSFFDWDKARDKSSGIFSYYNNDTSTLWTIGKLHKGRILLHQSVIGHELNHSLNFKEVSITNPDKLEELFK